jgi:transposase-like protein
VAHRSPGQGFQRFGSYSKPSDFKRIPRFRCRDCKRTCSRQTFSTTYYLKRPALLFAVASGLAACSAHRQIARSAHCSKTSVTRMAERRLPTLIAAPWEFSISGSASELSCC